MEKIFILIYLLFFNYIFSQIGFNVEYEADYKLECKMYKKPGFGTYETGFALLMNGKESYFKNMNKYIVEYLKLEKKIVSYGYNLKDELGKMKYYKEFN